MSAAVLLGARSHAITLPLSTTTLTVPLPTITVTLPTTTLTLPRTTTTVTVPSTTTVTLAVSTTTVALPHPTTTTIPLTATTTLPLTTTSITTTGQTTSTTTSGLPPLLTVTTTTVSTRPPTTSADPVACTPAGCDDGNPCTEDRCDASGGCRHVPLTGPACDDGDPCTSGDRCSAGLCSGARIGCAAAPRCPETCADDGFSCTDEVCTAAGCLHVPVDSRCVPPGQCTTAVCAPGLPGADEAGCVPGTAREDGQDCAEDADPCTLDVCRGGECVHERTTATNDCAPVEGVFRETLALGSLTGDLLAEVASEAPPSAGVLVVRLTRVRDDLAAATRALAGEQAAFVPATPHATSTSGSPAPLRARIAFTHVLRTPREVAAFIEQVSAAQAQGQLDGSAVRKLRRGGRRLLTGTKLLKAELRQLAGAKDRTRARKRRAIGPALQTSTGRL